MSLFTGYHYLQAEANPAPAGAGAPGPVQSDPPTGMPVEFDDARLFVSQIKSTLAEKDRLLDVERAHNRAAREAVLALANRLCQDAVERERRERGDAALANMRAQDLCRFIDQEVRQLFDAIRRASGGNLVEEYRLLLAQNIALQQQLAERQRAQIMPEATEPAPEPKPQPRTPAPSTVSTNPEPAPSSNRERLDDLIRLLAATGLARFSKVRERLNADWGLDPKSSSVRAVVDAAIQQGWLKVFEIKNDWQGATRALFLELTPSGRARANTLGTPPAPSELETGLRRGLSLPQINLNLRAADLLRAAGHTGVEVCPEPITLPDGRPYLPTISAVAATGQRVFVECERERVSDDRADRWLKAAAANHGEVYLVTTTPVLQEALVSEVNFARLRQPFRLLATNVVDCLRRMRGPQGSLWLYQSAGGPTP